MKTRLISWSSRDNEGLVGLTKSQGVVAPLLQAARGAVKSYRLSFDGDDESVVRLPEAAAVELIRKLAAAVGEGSTVRQIVPFALAPDVPRTQDGTARSGRFAPQFWKTDEFTQVVARILAANQRKVERLYLVPPGGVAAQTVEHRLESDQSSKIKAKWFRIAGDSAGGNRVDSVMSRTPMSNMWIVDNAVVLLQEATAAGPPVWRVSAKSDDLNEAHLLWRQLWGKAERGVSAATDDLDLTDPLVISAEQMAAAAPMSCSHSNGTLQHCDWYHGAWQYLRLFDMVSSPRWHHDFYLDKLSDALGKSPKQRVLITGSADYSMLAYVAYALRSVAGGGKVPRVDVMDRCATPLNACRWYARRAGLEVRVHEMDVCKPDMRVVRKASYDLITTDALLTRFPSDEHEKVLRSWYNLLAPEGRIVTTVRLHSSDQPYEGVSDEVSDFVARARQGAQRWRPYLRAGIDEIAADAREYAQRITSSDLGDGATVKKMFKSHGFDVISASVADLHGETCKTQYLRIVAAKKSLPIK
jgi:hypothetical protein